MLPSLAARPAAFGCLCLLLNLAQAFYIPGFSVRTYKTGESIPLFVNKIHSSKSQLQYAYASLPFVCQPSGKKAGPASSPWTSGTTISLNLGEVLRGDRISVSDYALSVGQNAKATKLCEVTVDDWGLAQARDVISEGYVAEWIVDNLPGATSFVSGDKSKKYYAAGFPLGREELDDQGEPRYFLNNHVTLKLLYRSAAGTAGEKGEKVIVGFEVYPKSISLQDRDKDGIPKHVDKPRSPFELPMAASEAPSNDRETMQIPYTYSVVWVEDKELEWSNRWDVYFVNQDDSSRIHWFATINSIIICALLTAIVAVILARTVGGDIAAGQKDSEGGIKMRQAKTPRKSTDNNGLLAAPDAQGGEEDDGDLPLDDISGWKLLHGDVFRGPSAGGLLAALIGSGTQLIFMAAGLVALSCLGVLNPSFRGGFISVGFALFILAGTISGYVSGRIYATFGGQSWRKNSILTATLVPGLLFAIIFVLNFFVWAQASSTAIPFGTLVALLALWLLIQLPLVYLGSYTGYKRVGPWTHPLKTNAVARQIPSGPANSRSRTVWSVLAAGLLPFAVIFIELLFVFKNLWQDKTGFYYVFGFMALVSGLLLITVIEVTMVAVYLRLCAENHNWQWYAFFVGGASSVWVYGYCAWFYFVKLHIEGFVSGMLFFSYAFLACAVYGVLTGAVGWMAAYAFVRRIYAAIKVD